MNNWYIIVAAIAVIVVAAIAVYRFILLPRGQKLNRIKEWLLWAVTEAEKMFGSQTGQIKLRYVYDLFITRFPFISKFVPFEKFSGWVDLALEKLRKLLESNERIQEYVGIGIQEKEQ